MNDVFNAAMALLKLDCRSSICMFATEKTGQRTNGPCRCLDHPGGRLQLQILVAKCKQYQHDHNEATIQADEDLNHR